MRVCKKIIFFGSYADSLLNFRLNLMKDFQKNGYSVVAVAPSDITVATELESMGIRFHSVPLKRNSLNPFSDFLLALKLYKIFRLEKPNLIFSYTIKPVIYGSIVSRIAGISNIYSMITGVGYVFMGGSIKSRILCFLVRRVLELALSFNKVVFFQNTDNLELYREKKIISFHQSTVLINGSGVDCETFMPQCYPEKVAFLMIARLLNDKGVQEYVAAAKAIRKIYPQTKFYLVGWIDTNPKAISQSELNEWIQEGVVEYLGKLSDVKPAIARASVYILPSYHEGMPRTVLEAMAMARPIITTDVPGCRETVVPGKNGFLVKVKNIPELIMAMEYFILKPDQVKCMGSISRELAIEKFEIQKINSSLLKAMSVE